MDQLRARQNELARARAVSEAELMIQGKGGVDQQLVIAHAQDIRGVLEDTG